MILLGGGPNRLNAAAHPPKSWAQLVFLGDYGANLRRPSSDAVGCAVRALVALPGAENLLHCSMCITVDKGTPQAQVYKNIVVGKLFCVAVPGVGNGRHSVKLNKNESLRAMQYC